MELKCQFLFPNITLLGFLISDLRLKASPCGGGWENLEHSPFLLPWLTALPLQAWDRWGPLSQVGTLAPSPQGTALEDRGAQ